MIDTPQIVQTTAQQTAFIHITVPRTEIQNVMGPGLAELMATLAAQGISAAAPWFTHHLRMQPDTFDSEISVPVTSPVSPSGRVQAGFRPAATVVRTVYQGDYEGLGPAWGEFDAWITAQGHEAGPDLWEVYLAGPETGAGPDAWRTELSRPMVR